MAYSSPYTVYIYTCHSVSKYQGWYSCPSFAKSISTCRSFAIFCLVSVHFATSGWRSAISTPTSARSLRALKRPKSGRAPGPDQLPYYLKCSFLEYYNHCFLTSTAPTHWKLSNVVMLYKGNNKDSRSPSSYRPLSLANSIYKVYASMIQSRLAYYLDHRLQAQHFGFRAGRSISTLLFILRRLTELFERHSSSLYILFLDWSQAFDSVSHPALRAALLRYGVPPQTVNSIMALYHQAQFFVPDRLSTSSTRSIGRGIRQGCPLSPYLFVVVLSAISDDLHSIFQALFRFSPWTHSANLHLTDVEFADDAVLISRTNIALMRLLHLLQYLALRIGLSLNPSKCQLLAFHGNLPVSLSSSVTPFQACTCEYCAPAIAHPIDYDALLPPLVPLFSAKYLGSFIAPTSSPAPDIIFRCSQASTAFKQPEPCLRHHLISQRQKFTGWSSKLFHLLKSPKLIPFITRHYARNSSNKESVLPPSTPTFRRLLLKRIPPKSFLPNSTNSYTQFSSNFWFTNTVSWSHVTPPPFFEYSLTFNPSGTLGTLSSPYRRGAPAPIGQNWPLLKHSTQLPPDEILFPLQANFSIRFIFSSLLQT